MSWADEQKWEAACWGDCHDTSGKELKQFVYAKRMGLFEMSLPGTWPHFDLRGKSILDIGGGPVSLLLKCRNFRGTVADPLPYPDWVARRYRLAGIDYLRIKGEDISGFDVDEVWIYNVLQHVDDLEKVVANARSSGRIIRLFEWVDNGVSPGHPHDLKRELLDKWLGKEGTVEDLEEVYGVSAVPPPDHGLCKGRAYYGVFDAVS